MSEHLQDVNAQPASPQMAQPAPAALSPEQLESVKRSLIENLHKIYGQFISSICNFPCAQLPMQEAFRHFDTGFLWFEKAIVNMPMPPVQVSQVQPPEAQFQPAEESANQAVPEAPINHEEVAQPAA